jgi:hypothetical protein
VRGESTLESPIAARPCVAFGLAGEVSGSAVDDAMGADFALELDDRRRVLVELDHAVLEVDAPGSPAPAKAEDYLAEVLAGRGLPADGVALVEHVLSDGDEVTIEGELREEGIAQTGYRDATPARVLRGTPAAPLRIKKLAVSVES